jgi:hypothetical protein
MDLDESDLQTESFSNARGWTAVRVTHVPTTTVAERSRTDSLRSAVQAQRECIDEIRRVLSGGAPDGPAAAAASAGSAAAAGSAGSAAGVVSREEFERLAERVARLEQEIGGAGYGG